MNLTLKFFVILAFGLHTLPSQAHIHTDPYYKCLKALILAEQFESQSYSYNIFEYILVDGKPKNIIDINKELKERELCDLDATCRMTKKSNGFFGSDVKPTLAKREELVKQHNDLIDKRDQSLDLLMKRTYTFDSSHEGSRFFTGSPPKVLATRSKEDGQYLYFLTKNGARMIKASDAKKPYNGYIIVIKTQDNRNPQGWFEEVSLSGSSITDSESTLKHTIDIADLAALSPQAYANESGKKFIDLDYTNLDHNRVKQAELDKVFTEEFEKLFERVVQSHANQLDYLTKLDDNQKQIIARQLKLSPENLAQNYTQSYTSALQTCANVGVGTSKVLDTINKVNASQNKSFPQKETKTEQIIKENQ